MKGIDWKTSHWLETIDFWVFSYRTSRWIYRPNDYNDHESIYDYFNGNLP